MTGSKAAVVVSNAECVPQLNFEKVERFFLDSQEALCPNTDAMLVLGHEDHGQSAVTVPVGNAFLACPSVTGASKKSPRSNECYSRDIRIVRAGRKPRQIGSLVVTLLFAIVVPWEPEPSSPLGD
jgi:hypothetical protein